MRLYSHKLLLPLLALALSGCVTAERYNALEGQYISERQARGSLSSELAAERQRSAELARKVEEAQRRLDALTGQLGSTTNAAMAAREQLDDAQNEALEWRKRHEALAAQKAGINARLQKALEELGKMEGIEFNSQRGRLALSNKLLFQSGQSYISVAGRQALQKLASAMRGGTERLRIEGHTDSDPVTSLSTWRYGNWSLSGARAMEVLAVLEQSGIQGARMHFVGHGPHRPVAPNDDAVGKSRNRRVEIFVLPQPRSRPLAPASEAGDEAAPEGALVRPAVEGR